MKKKESVNSSWTPTTGMLTGWLKASRRVAMLLLTTLLLTMTAQTTWAETVAEVKYLDKNGNECTCAEATVLTGNESSIGVDDEETWYIAQDELAYNVLSISANCHLILADGATLNLSNQISYASPTSLTIYAQSTGNGMGALTVATTSYYAAVETDGGDLTINGGRISISSTGNDGINTTQDSGDPGTLTINGGNVTCIGGLGYKGVNTGVNGLAHYSKGENATVEIVDNVQAGAAKVSYLDTDGQTKTVYAVALTGNESGIGEPNEDTWYIAQGSLAYNVLSISGNCHLILADGAALNLSNQISYASPTSLTIYAQSTGESMGALTVATTSYYAAIETNGGDLTINGGLISISSTNNDGIKTTQYSGNPGTLAINGGNVTCIGGLGYKGVNTVGTDGLAHYSKGANATVEIVDNVPAGAAKVSYLDTDGQTKTVYAVVLTGNESSIGESGQETWYIAQDELTYSYVLSISGNCHLILANGAALNLSNQISYASPTSLTIYAQSTGESMGALTVATTSYYAAIETNGGDLTINGGLISISSTEKDGINTTQDSGDPGTLTINGGDVTCIGGLGYKGVNTVGTDGLAHYSKGANATVEIVDNVQAGAAKVSYLDTDGQTKTVYAVALTGNESDIGVPNKDTWYIAQGSLAYNVLSISGNCHLILEDGAALNLSDQISYASPTSLTIYAQSTGESMGALTVATSDIAVETNGGDLTINGGRISISSTGDDGINTTNGDNTPGTLTINGGDVTCIGGLGYKGVNTVGTDGLAHYSKGANATVEIVDNVPAGAAKVSYLDTDGQTKTVYAVVLTGNESSIGESGQETWYIAQDELTYSYVLSISGNCHLILANGAALNLSNQISYASPTSLTIYAQSTGESMGALTVATTSYYAAVATNGGDLTINGGLISISSTNNDGINTTQYSGDPGTLTINGGNVTCIGGLGYKGVNTGGTDGLAHYSNGANATVEIGDNVPAGAAKVSYLDTDGQTKTVYAVALTGNESSIGESGQETWYIAQDELTYSYVLSISGNCHLILANGAALNLSNQISYASPTSLTIYAQSTGESMGALTVATTSYYAAVATNGGDLTINGGRISISSTGDDGINTTNGDNTPGTLTINGGDVTCIGGPDNKGINTGGNDGLAHYVHNGGTVDFGSGAFTFIFNANGGSGTMSNQKIIVNHTKELHACTFTLEDCAFEGWATTADGPVVYTNEQSITPTEAGTVTLYAKWRSVVYLIAFDANGGTGTMSNQKITVGETQNLHACTFTLEDCVFDGWATTADGNVAYTNEQSITPTEAGSVTLYAKWSYVAYFIAFDANGGSGTMSNQRINVGETQNLTDCTFTRNGYSFAGWATTADGEVAYNNGAPITPSATGFLKLYAKWVLLDWAATHSGDSWNDAYIIYEASQLEEIATTVNAGSTYKDKYFKLGGNITYDKTVTNNHTAIGTSTNPFMGHFDGQGYTISGIRMNGTGDYGLFGFINDSGAEVKNLTLADAQINVGPGNIGGIVGYKKDGAIVNCRVTSDVIINVSNTYGGTYYGGIIGQNYKGAIEYCVSSASVIDATGNQYVGYGGIAGWGAPRNSLVIDATISSPQGYVGAVSGFGGYLEDDNNIYTYGTKVNGATGSGHGHGIGTDEASSNKMGYVVTTLPALIPAATGDFQVKTLGSYGLNYDGTNYITLFPLSEDEGVSYLTTNLASETSVPVEFKRSFTGGKPSTVCLPFALSSTQVSTFDKFFFFKEVDMTGSDWVVTMQETAGDNMVTDGLTANTPYLFLPGYNGERTFTGTVDVTNLAAAGTTPTTGSTDGWVFRGTYERINWTTDPQYIYGFAAAGTGGPGEGVFFRVKGGSNSYALPFRAYLDRTDGANALARGAGSPETLPDVMLLRLIDADGVTTAIGTISTKTGEVSFDGWYTLSGHRLPGKPTEKGVYINNGHKVVVK